MKILRRPEIIIKFHLFFLFIIFAALSIASININGLNNRIKQLSFINFLRFNKIDIIFLQEHNLRSEESIIPELSDHYIVILNLSIAHKGGTGIIINKDLNVRIKNCEKSANSRIISLNIDLYNNPLHLINIYAPAGSTRERDDFFKEDLPYYLRNSLENSVLGGDFNCILHPRDSTSKSTHICKSLNNIFKDLSLKDVWWLCNRDVEHTFVRNNYGSRLDRIYAKSLVNCINNVYLKHTNISDHSCIIINLSISNMPKIGKYYWKMNSTLLDDINIKNDFSIEWSRMKFLITRYDSINDWWSLYAKRHIKQFFIKKGKQMNQKKYGMLNYLEFCLNRLYNKNNIEQRIEYDQVKYLKDRITGIKDNILQGVKVRSRIEEQLVGETVSTFLIKKQAQIKEKQFISEVKSEANIIDNLNEGILLNNKDMIEFYIRKYYEKLYNDEPVNENDQAYFLNLIENKLCNQDKVTLASAITDQEIFNAVKGLNPNKAPGIDGIPIEFYQKFWDIIKFEMITIIKNIITGKLLQNHQKKAIITLLPKGGDPTLLKTWRPISLICSDVKIISKILANRIKPVLKNIISPDQYCVNGKTISECNSKLRDSLYYYGKNKSSGAVINLDWEKAFDRVNWSFLIKVMEKMGFPDMIIKWVLVMHTNLQSICMINGNLTSPFNIKRGVRQGCPMSMIYYVLFQEPLYIALEKSRKITPPMLPLSQTKKLGYADDSSILVQNDEGFTETFQLVEKFQNASNAKLNLNKTKVYGFGSWSNRINWPIIGLQIEQNYFTTLGITFSCNYNLALNTTWTRVINKIKNRIPLIRNNFYTINQKSCIVNSLLLSKIWYVAHVYPLPVKFSDQIDTLVSDFIWKPRYHPISKVVLQNPRSKGGIGLLDHLIKARCIFAATVMKLFINSSNSDIIKYFMIKKLNPMPEFRNNSLIIDRRYSNFSTPYYEYSIDIIRQCTQIRNFPSISSKNMYTLLKKDTKPRVENLYPNFEWNVIWNNVQFKYINIYDRHIVYKFLHEILTNNHRLFTMRRRDSPVCNTCGVSETNVHMFIYCFKVQDCLSFLHKLIFYLCNLNTGGNILRYFFMYFPKINKKIQNTLCIIMSSYISCVWANRECQDNVLYRFRAKVIKEQNNHMLILDNKVNDIFTENYCNILRNL